MEFHDRRDHARYSSDNQREESIESVNPTAYAEERHHHR